MSILFDGDGELYEMAESGLHDYFCQAVSPDFYHAHEVDGVCFVNHPCAPTVSVRADFLLYPRQHLIDAGFADTWFAVEIKRGRHHIEDGCRQAFWYTLSRFQLKDKEITPGFACAWSPSPPSPDDNDACSTWRVARSEGFRKGIESSFAYLNVGLMRINFHQGRKLYKWEISMHGAYARNIHEHGVKVLTKSNRSKFLLRAGNGCQIMTHSGLTGDSSDE